MSWRKQTRYQSKMLAIKILIAYTERSPQHVSDYKHFQIFNTITVPGRQMIQEMAT